MTDQNRLKLLNFNELEIGVCPHHYLSCIPRKCSKMSYIKQNKVSKSTGNCYNIRYASDTIILAENTKDLQNLLTRIAEAGDEFGLQIIVRKTKVMARPG